MGVDPHRSFSRGQPPAGYGAGAEATNGESGSSSGAAAANGSSSSSSGAAGGSDPQEVVHRRARNLASDDRYGASVEGHDVSFARAAGVSAREWQDTIHQRAPRGYF